MSPAPSDDTDPISGTAIQHEKPDDQSENLPLRASSQSREQLRPFHINMADFVPHRNPGTNKITQVSHLIYQLPKPSIHDAEWGGKCNVLDKASIKAQLMYCSPGGL